MAFDSVSNEIFSHDLRVCECDELTAVFSDLRSGQQTRGRRLRVRGHVAMASLCVFFFLGGGDGTVGPPAHQDHGCFFPLCVCAGPIFSGYDDTSSDNSTADAADPSAASPEPSAAPGSSPAATGPHVTAGNVHGTAARFRCWTSCCCLTAHSLEEDTPPSLESSLSPLLGVHDWRALMCTSCFFCSSNSKSSTRSSRNSSTSSFCSSSMEAASRVKR